MKTICFALLLPIFAHAYEGKITFVQGEVSHKLGAVLKGGETLRTGPGATVIVTMEDGAIFKLSGKSIFSVPVKGKGEVTLTAGALFSKIPKQKPDHPFRVYTTTAVMGVRGTQFFTSFGEEQKSDVWMCVNEGSVEVTSTKDQKKVLVHEGEGVLVGAEKGVTPPQKYEWTKGLNWNMDPAQGEVLDKSKIKYDKKLLIEEYD